MLQRMMTEKPEKYQHMLQNLVFKAQQVIELAKTPIHETWELASLYKFVNRFIILVSVC